MNFSTIQKRFQSIILFYLNDIWSKVFFIDHVCACVIKDHYSISMGSYFCFKCLVFLDLSLKKTIYKTKKYIYIVKINTFIIYLGKNTNQQRSNHYYHTWNTTYTDIAGTEYYNIFFIKLQSRFEYTIIAFMRWASKALAREKTTSRELKTWCSPHKVITISLYQNYSI